MLVVVCWMAVVGPSVSIAEESTPATYRPVVGEPHPDFVLPRIDDGKPLKLSDFRGTKVLLVHFASW